jgi:hypothetical protein
LHQVDFQFKRICNRKSVGRSGVRSVDYISNKDGSINKRRCKGDTQTKGVNMSGIAQATFWGAILIFLSEFFIIGISTKPSFG